MHQVVYIYYCPDTGLISRISEFCLSGILPWDFHSWHNRWTAVPHPTCSVQVVLGAQRPGIRVQRHRFRRTTRSYWCIHHRRRAEGRIEERRKGTDRLCPVLPPPISVWCSPPVPCPPGFPQGEEFLTAFWRKNIQEDSQDPWLLHFGSFIQLKWHFYVQSPKPTTGRI